MARGFESKSVEEQQNEADRAGTATNKAALQSADAHKKRRIQELSLQREHILSQRTSVPHRRTALEAALADIEEKLAELGWTVHM